MKKFSSEDSGRVKVVKLACEAGECYINVNFVAYQLLVTVLEESQSLKAIQTDLMDEWLRAEDLINAKRKIMSCHVCRKN